MIVITILRFPFLTVANIYNSYFNVMCSLSPYVPTHVSYITWNGNKLIIFNRRWFGLLTLNVTHVVVFTLLVGSASVKRPDASTQQSYCGTSSVRRAAGIANSGKEFE